MTRNATKKILKVLYNDRLLKRMTNFPVHELQIR